MYSFYLNKTRRSTKQQLDLTYKIRQQIHCLMSTVNMNDYMLKKIQQRCPVSVTNVKVINVLNRNL